MSESWLTAALVLIALGFVVQSLRLWVAKSRPSRRARSRARRAIAGEAEARVLLEDAGYRVDASQAPAELVVTCDGDPIHIRLRADFLVSRDGERLVADAKTGALAASLRHGPTRRQLLEYALSYQVDGVLLVDVEAGVIRRVEFAVQSSGA